MRAFVSCLFILLGFISTVTAGTLPQTAHYISADGLSHCQKVGQICNVGLVTSTGLVRYSVSDPTVCTVSGSGIVTVIGGGLCAISVEMLGDATYAYSAGTLAMGVMTGVSPAVAISPDSKDTSNSAKSNSQAAGTNANAPGMCPAANSASRDPVDLATGYFYETLNLLDVAAAGAPLQFNLSYSSGYPAAGSSGFGWGHHYQYGLVDLTTSINISWPDRHVSSYTANGVGGYNNSAADVSDVLVKNVDGSYTLTDRRQKVYSFDASGKLSSTVDRLGFVLNFSYLVNGNLDRVTDVLSGRFLQFTYDLQNHVTSVSSTGAGAVALAYSAAGDLVSVTDPLGNLTSFTYDINHRLLTKTNALGVVIVTNTYDVFGRVSSQDDGVVSTPLELFTYSLDAVTGFRYVGYQDRIGGMTQHNFNADLKSVGVVDPAGGTENYDYNFIAGDTYRDTMGVLTQFNYDASGYIRIRTNALGQAASYTYDVEHNILSSTDEAGNVTTMTYGPNHQLLTTTDAAGGVTTNTYNPQGLLATVTSPTGGITSSNYDAQGNLISQVDAAGVTTGYTYDAAGRMLTRTDGAGNVWTSSYDLMGHLLTVADPLANTTRYTYDILGRMVTKTSANGGITHYGYDVHDNLISRTDPLAGVASFAYDADDKLISATDALGHVTTMTRDIKGRVITITDALGNNKTQSYNAADDVVTTSDAQNNQTNLAYDALRRLTSVTDPLNQSAAQSYDAVSRVTSRTDAKGGTNSFGYDALGQLISSGNALGGSAAQTYDANGNRLSFTDANGNVTRFTYDVANRVVGISTADGGAVSYTYNTRNLIATATNARAQIATYTYNAAGRLVTLADPAGTITYTYDANGNVLTVGDAVGTTTYTYDLLNRITSVTDVFGNRIAYGYDTVGNLTTLTYPGNKVVTYAYDAANRMVSVTDWSAHVSTYSYDAKGQMTAIARANGTRGAYVYDAKGQLSSIAETTTGNASMYAIAYTYDANGNITSEVTTPTATSPVVVSGSATYGVDNRLATANALPVTYDADGNMTSGPLNGVTSAYSFDARSRLTGVAASSYVYNAQGNRVSATNTGVVTRYVVDPNAALPRVLMETTAAGVPVAYYVYGMGLVSREDAAAVYQTYHYDLRGSTLRLTGATGVVTDSYRYGPYGELASTTGVTANPFRYNGRDGVMTEANGLYYMRARYYAPEVKRFVSRDTLLGSVEQTLSLNRFAYVNGNPIGFVDPSGMSAVGTSLLGVGITLGLLGPETWLVAAGMIAVGGAINYGDHFIDFVLGSEASASDVIPRPGFHEVLSTRRSADPACRGMECVIRTVTYEPDVDPGLISTIKQEIAKKVLEDNAAKGICPDTRHDVNGVRG